MRTEGDTTSLIGNNVYSITRDHLDNIWIGTFGNGLCKTTANDYKKLSFTHYNTENNQLSNNMVRNIYCDSDSNIWVATSFGLNLLRADSLHNYRPKFQSFFHDPFGSSQVNYNDIVEIFEDSKRQVWFGTFGGGVNKVSLPLGNKLSFGSVTTQNGLSNDVIFGILEDDQDRLWFSSEYGLSRYNQEDETFEIFNESNGLSFNNFSENTCFKLQNGKLIFGGAQGIEMIDPSMILKHQSKNLLELTQFQLFNKDVEV